MRLVIFGDIEYCINFTYAKNGDWTYCFIHENGKLTKTEFALKHPQDSGNRKIGRDLAFQRAIKDYPRELRIELWNAYKQKIKVHWK